MDAGAGMPIELFPPCAFTQATYSAIDLAGVPGDTASPFTKVAKPPSGVKSACGLKPGRATTCGRIEMVWSCDKNTVVPSGAAPLSSCAASWPPAPGRLSTITGRLSSSFSFSASRRAMASLPPPGGKPTMMRIGRSSDAQAELSPAGSATAAAAKRAVNWRRDRCVDMANEGLWEWMKPEF